MPFKHLGQMLVALLDNAQSGQKESKSEYYHG